jgi:hypothetical protein
VVNECRAQSISFFPKLHHNEFLPLPFNTPTPAVNLTSPGHYFVFDEALKRFGVSFVKQNIRGKLVDSDDLRQQISSVQAEKDRLTLLVSEYVGDMVLVKENQAVKSRKEALWKLAHELLAAFSSAEPITHELFKNAKEMKETGFQRLFTCYNLGVSRLKAILRQDVYKIEKQNLVGRRIPDIVRYKSEVFRRQC